MDEDKIILEKFLSLAKGLIDRGYEKAEAGFIVIECNREDVVDLLISYLRDNPSADKDDIDVWLYGEDGQGNHITIFDDEEVEE